MSEDVHTLEIDKLTGYLVSQIEGFEGPMTAEKFPDGQSNPTFLLRAKSGSYVLRRQPPGKLLKSAHAVDREYRVLSALADTDVPVPRTCHLCEDRAVIGSMFYVMSFETGRSFWDAALPELAREQRTAYYQEIIRVMAAMHNLDLDAIGLADYGRPGNYFERQIATWTKQYRAAETEVVAAMDTLIEWLPKNLPVDDGQVSLVHGDYRLDNVIFHPEQPEVLAVLDWELSTLGHPFADLAYFCMGLRLPPNDHILGLGGQDREQLGVPSEAEIVKQYCDLRGLAPIDNWDFYLVFSFFRLAAIAQGVVRRALDGNASSKKALKAGPLAALLAKMAVELIEGNEK